MKTHLSLAAVALILAACNPPADKPAPAAEATAAEATAAVVTAADAWCRPSPNGAKAGGCYVTLTADDRRPPDRRRQPARRPSFRSTR
jgi:periplasmic copper chaperone A